MDRTVSASSNDRDATPHARPADMAPQDENQIIAARRAKLGALRAARHA